MNDRDIAIIVQQLTVNMRQLVIDEIDRRMRIPTGVDSGGPYTSFSVNDQGQITDVGFTTRNTFSFSPATENNGIPTGSSEFNLTFTGDSADWLNGTSSTELILPYTGIIVIVLGLLWQITGSPFVTTVGDRQVRIIQQRSASDYDEMKFADSSPKTTSYFENRSYSAMFNVEIGDTLQIMVSHNSGVAMKCYPDMRIAYI